MTRNGLSPTRGDEHQFWLDAGNPIKIAITMQKRYARKNSVLRYEAIICGSRSYACPSTSSVQVCGAARCVPCVGRSDQRQFAEDPIPASESVGATRAL
jgi:hypothetical protein